MAPKIFLTGSTGYIGGDAFATLYKAHPEYDYTLLVRNEARGDLVKKAFPDAKNIRFVYGNLDAHDVIADAAANADLVLHTAESADDVPSAKAIADGLAKGHSAENPGVWIHISGTAIITWNDFNNNRFSQPPLPDQTYDDYDGVERLITGLPDNAPHRNVDQIVLKAATENPKSLRTAIVAPPTIYGRGRGPVNQRSIQVYDMAEYLLKRGYAPIIEGPGESVWDNVHVHDLSDLLVRLVEAGLNPAEREKVATSAAETKGALFGPYAYYFVRAGTHKWSDVARWLAAEAVAKGLVKASSPEEAVKQVPMSEVTAPDAPGLPNGGNGSWGTNSRGDAVRAHKLLGWAPRGLSLRDEIPNIVAEEAARVKSSSK